MADHWTSANHPKHDELSAQRNAPAMGRQFAGASSAAKIQTPATRHASPSIDNADVSSSEPGAPNIAGTSTAAGKKRSDRSLGTGPTGARRRAIVRKA